MKVIIPERVVELTFAEYVGERIRSRRQELGMTSKELAARAGLQPSRVTQTEIGGSALTLRKMLAVSVALGKPLDWFVAGWEEQELKK